MKAWAWGIVVVIALAGFAAAVWFAGPMIGIGEANPLDPASVRAAIIAALTAAAGACLGIGLWRSRRSSTGLVGDEFGEIGQQVRRALETLQRSSGRRVLWKLPKYLVIGPPHSGKTMAIANSGLASVRSGPADLGDAPDVELWLAGDALLVDTAGTLTTQDHPGQQANWRLLLSLLKKDRPQRPVDGVVVVFSLADVMTLSGHELGAQAMAVRQRLREIQNELAVGLNVHALFTKADLIAGFAEFFGRFDENRRRKVWGAALPERHAGGVTEDVAAEFDALAARLAAETADRLHEEPDASARLAIFGFPQQFAALNGLCTEFLNRIFEQGTQGHGIELRGFYFSASMRESAPIDHLLGVAAHSCVGDGLFLRDLMGRVISGAGGQSFRTTRRRARVVRAGGFAAVALAAVALLGMWGVSFATNRSLIASTEAMLDEIGAEPHLESAAVADVDLENIVGVLAALRDLPIGYTYRELPTPIHATFGLSQRGKLLTAGKTAYRQAAERLLRSRLILQLERTIQANIGAPSELYEPLKVYLMLVGEAPRSDDELIVAWIKRDWEQNRYPGPANRDGRAELERHLRAMLALDDGHDPTIGLNRPLVQAAQRSLARIEMADLAWALIKSATYGAQLEHFSVPARAGLQSSAVFETLDGRRLEALSIPGIYTYRGFNDFLLPQLAAMADMISNDQWLLGAGGEQVGVEEQLKRLGPELLDRYGKEFVAAWGEVLDNLKLKPLAAEKPDYVSLAAASAPASPLKQLVEAVAAETRLTRTDPEKAPEDFEGSAEAAANLARIGIQLAGSKSQSRAGAAFLGRAAETPGAGIEAQFRRFHVLVEGETGRRPVDALVENFFAVYQSLVLAANNPMQVDHANANLQLQVLNLRANASRLPQQLARMVNAAADDFEGDVARTSIAQLDRMLAVAVGNPCSEVVAGAYPFDRMSQRDVPIADFARLFAPNGEIDRFFAQNLAPMADLSGGDWRWKQDSRLGRELSSSTLRAFQKAAEIRDTFFPQGSAAPAITITFTPFSMNGDADMALLDIDGQVVQSYQTGSAPTTVSWPVALSSGAVDLSLTPAIPGRESQLHFDGPWALMRLFDTGSISESGGSLQARFVIGGRDVTYNVQVNSRGNPFLLPALSEFTCPTGL